MPGSDYRTTKEERDGERDERVVRGVGLADICKVDLKTIHNWVTRGTSLRSGRQVGTSASRRSTSRVYDEVRLPVPASLVADAAASASAGAGEAPKTETSAAPAVVELTDEQRAAVAGWLALPAITRRSAMIELGECSGRFGKRGVAPCLAGAPQGV